MRRLTIIFTSILLAAATTVAKADPQSYCQVYSKDFADIRTSNVDQWQLVYRGAFDDCMRNYNAKPSADSVGAAVAEQVPAAAPVAAAATEAPAAENAATEASDPVVGPEDPSVMKAKAKSKKAAAPKAKKVAMRAAPTTAPKASGKGLVPGSDEWNAYCEAKYSSFNKQSGTYLSRTGKIRRCR